MKHLLEKLRARFNAATDKHDAEMPVTMKNYILLHPSGAVGTRRHATRPYK